MATLEREDDRQCPIISAWMKLDDLVSRAASGKIAIVGTSMDRQTVSENAEILEPLLLHLGILAQFNSINPMG